MSRLILTASALVVSCFFAGCVQRAVLPEKGGMRSLKCEVVTSPHSSAATKYTLTVDEKTNTAFIKYASGKTLPAQALFSPEDVTLKLSQGDAMENAMRTHGTSFGGTTYGRPNPSGGMSIAFDFPGRTGTETTFKINRESGELTYQQLILGKRNQEKPALGTCVR